MANIIYTVPLAENSVNAVVAFSLSANSNTDVYIGGGNNGQALITDGAGNLSWSNVGTGNGTVTNVATSGSGLGFTLTGGPITTTGTITLTVPNATSLRSSLTIGNVANLNLNGNGSTVLAGNGSFIVPTGTYSNANVANYLPIFTGNIGNGGLSGNANYIYANWINAANAVGGNLVTGTTGNIITINSTTGNFSGNVGANIFNGNIGNITTINATTVTATTGNITTVNSTTINGTTGNFSGNISSGNANLGNLATANYLAGTLTTASQPNITSTGTLISLSVSGNANVGNLNTGGRVSAVGNIIGGNISAVGNGIFGNVSGGNLISANYVSGTLITGSQPNITSIGTLTSLSVTGTANIQSINTYGNATTPALIFPNALEPVTANSSGANGNITLSIATQSLLYYYGNATGNVTLNITNVGSMMPSNNSMTCAFLMTNGSTAYYVAQLEIDGSSITPKWIGNVTPNGGHANSIDAYTYTIIKAGSGYTVLGALTQYA